MGCSSPSGQASPSTVVTWRPSACAARTVHDFTDSPSSSTVHAPHEVVSQPTLVAVRPRLAQEVHEQQAVLDLAATAHRRPSL